MILFPASDLKDGACVRLARGDMHRIAKYVRAAGRHMFCVNPMHKNPWSRA